MVCFFHSCLVKNKWRISVPKKDEYIKKMRRGKGSVLRWRKKEKKEPGQGIGISSSCCSPGQIDFFSTDVKTQQKLEREREGKIRSSWGGNQEGIRWTFKERPAKTVAVCVGVTDKLKMCCITSFSGWCSRFFNFTFFKGNSRACGE